MGGRNVSHVFVHVCREGGREGGGGGVQWCRCPHVGEGRRL